LRASAGAILCRAVYYNALRSGTFFVATPRGQAVPSKFELTAIDI
jgi:hypothetical protein